MRRLTPRRRPLVGRLGEERGAAAVMVALLMVPLLGFAALAVDVASVYSDRAQLQNAADAAALAVALDCARDNCGTAANLATASAVLAANTTSARVQNAAVRTPSVTTSASGVTVTVSADQTHWFAPAVGIGSSRVTATATARWMTTTRARANFPLAISWCEWQAQKARHAPSTANVDYRINGLTQGGAACTGPAGQSVTPGYLVTNPDSSAVCRTTSTLGSTIAMYPGMYSGGLPPTCTTAYLASLAGTDIFFPVWDAVNSSGGIHVYSYAAFHITNYDIASSDPALIGHFTFAAQQTDATTNTTSAVPDLGARSVYLQG